MSDIDLGGKAAIVTGGGGGMGSAMTLALAKAGAKVCALDVSQQILDGVARRAKDEGVGDRVLPVVCDITDFPSCENAVNAAVEAFGTVTMLVNNAGVGMQTINPNYMNEPAKFWLADVDRWQRMMDINFKGAFMLAKVVTPHMLEKDWGRIVNVTTSLDTMIRHNYSPYGQSKAALEAATSTWASDLDGTGVTVNVLVPGGPTNTGFIPESAPFDRTKLVQPEVMQAPIVWLASDRSNGITNCRFVGRDWDTSLPAEEAAQKVCAPAAWPNMGTQAAWPGAS